MSDEPKKRSRSLIFCWVFLALMVLIYPLSYGPAFRFACKSRDQKNRFQTLGTIYAPIGWLGRQSKWVRDVTVWYLELWTP
jgi:hypothetical protein